MSDYFEWQDSYSVGVALVDDDHKNLVGILNSAVHAVSEHKGSEAVREIFDDLLEYTVYHFSHEEALLERTQFPGLEEHRAIHDRLIRKLLTFHQDYRRRTVDIADVANFLIEWLLTHILEEDARFADHLRRHGIE